jgi:DNA-binding NtrC family response regulator/tetratricopeptide (TPR) repeat protein
MNRGDTAGNRYPSDAVAGGHSAFEEGRFDDAVSCYESALRSGAQSQEQEAQIRCRLSEAFGRLGLKRKQLDSVSRYENFTDLARLTEHTQLDVLVKLGSAHGANDDAPRAVALLNQAVRIARRLDDAASLGACFFGLGRVYRFLSELRIARDYFAAATEHFKRADDYKQLAESYFNLGNIDAREGNYRAALQSIERALATVGERDEPDLLGRIYHDLALIYDNIDLPTDRALECWEKSIEFFQKSGNSDYLAFDYNNLASKLTALGQWGRAEQMARAAVKLLEGGGRAAQLGATFDTLAQLCLLRGDLEQADLLIERSLEAFAAAREKRQLIAREFQLEASTQTTLGRCLLAKGLVEDAIFHFKRAVEISLRLGDRQYLAESYLWLAEGQLRQGRLDEARAAVAAVRQDLRTTPDIPVWGMLMRIQAMLEAEDGHIAAAIESLGQSTSIYEIKGNQYSQAVNRLVLARLLERQGRTGEAITCVRSALQVFERLGAAIDLREAQGYEQALITALPPLETTEQQQVGPATTQGSIWQPPDLVSAIDGFVAQRVVQASLSRELLLHELAAIAREQSHSSAAVVGKPVYSDPIQFEVVAQVGMDSRQAEHELELVAELPRPSFAANFVYSFRDSNESELILRLINPQSGRFVSGAITMEPLLRLVEQGLETICLKEGTSRTVAFNPARSFSAVELAGFVCASRAMNRVLEQIHKIRSSDLTVLITGESGTGKEVVARAVHAISSRRFNTFLPFNCSAAPRDLVESQLFGHRKGAFTGAVSENKGIVRAAEGGTLFLDEVGDLPLALQPKLLRFLQEGEIQPIGENQPVEVDVRVVAATNADLERAVADGRFREDLFHRINVIRIHVPPLRERREEIPALIDHYLPLYEEQAGKRDIKFSQTAMDAMLVYDWPGNVRQLCNELRRVVTYAESDALVAADALSPEIVESGEEQAASSVEAPDDGAGSPTLTEAIEALERAMIQDALRSAGGNIARAAKDLGLSRKGLYLKMDRFRFRT